MVNERTYLVTGSASGIGKATREALEGAGARVIGVDLAGAEIEADLGSPEGREAAIGQALVHAGADLDAVIACAGIAGVDPRVISVNYFGVVELIAGVHALLERGRNPRCVVIGSIAALHPHQPEVVSACLAGAEVRALELAGERPAEAYAASKAALCRWVRREAAGAAWAGSRIPLNAVCPGAVATPMTAGLRRSERGLASVAASVPMPMGGWMEPEDIVPIVCWLASAENTAVTGQIVFADNGADVALRGETGW